MWESSSPGCRSGLVGAERSLIWEAPGRVGSSPDNAGTDRYCQTVRVRLARSEGVTRVNQWLNPLKSGTGSNLVDAGRVAVHVEPTQGEATPTPGNVGRAGGHTPVCQDDVRHLM